MRLALLLLLAGCASTPAVRQAPSVYERCAASCPGGEAFTRENSLDVACFCRRPPVGS